MLFDSVYRAAARIQTVTEDILGFADSECITPLEHYTKVPNLANEEPYNFTTLVAKQHALLQPIAF